MLQYHHHRHYYYYYLWVKYGVPNRTRMRNNKSWNITRWWLLMIIIIIIFPNNQGTISEPATIIVPCDKQAIESKIGACLFPPLGEDELFENNLQCLIITYQYRTIIRTCVYIISNIVKRYITSLSFMIIGYTYYWFHHCIVWIIVVVDNDLMVTTKWYCKMIFTNWMISYCTLNGNSGTFCHENRIDFVVNVIIVIGLWC